MPYNLKHMYGAWRKCPICGKDFFVTHPDEYAYKRYKSRSHGTYLFFCKWSCMRAYDRAHIDGRKERFLRVSE